jgi:hypothetical protein
MRGVTSATAFSFQSVIASAETEMDVAPKNAVPSRTVLANIVLSCVELAKG